MIVLWQNPDTRAMRPPAAMQGVFALAGVMALVLLVLPGNRRPVVLQSKMQKSVYGEARPDHVNQAYVHPDGRLNHNRFKGISMHNDFEPDGGYPTATFAARKSRASSLTEAALAASEEAGAPAAEETEEAAPAVEEAAPAVDEVPAPAAEATEEAAPAVEEAEVAVEKAPAVKKNVVGSGSFDKLFKRWLRKNIWGSAKPQSSTLAVQKLTEEDGDDDHDNDDEDDSGELVFAFFVLLLPLIVLVVVLLILLPFMLSSQSDAGKVPGGDHLKSTADLIVKYLSPVEEMSPFKVGQIQKLISDINEKAGTAVAPLFIVLQVLFLLAFVGYFVVAVVALCVDWEAMSIECAETWVWLYVLLAVVIPTSFGFVMGGVKAGLALADLKKNVGWEIPDVLLALPGPIIYITLGILGIILWAGMSEECAAEYSSEYSMLFVVFKIQVILLGVASIFGVMTCFAQASVLIAQFRASGSSHPGQQSEENYQGDYHESRYV